MHMDPGEPSDNQVLFFLDGLDDLLSLVPQKLMVPESGSNARSIMRAIVVLPEPDSPANTKVSPVFIENEIPSATLMVSLLAPDSSFFIKYFFKLLTERISFIGICYDWKYIKRSYAQNLSIAKF